MKYSKVKVCLKEEPVVVTITSDEKPNVSGLIVNKWQDIINLIALTVNVPSALIMRLEEKHMCVFLESNTKGNPYNKGEKVELGSGLYCETVAGKKSCLLVPNALKDPLWKKNPDIELNMISYLGFPIIWPDGEVFGTICVLDNKENHYNNIYIKLIEILKDSIEKDLKLIMEEQNLKQQKEEFEAILENMSDTLYTINKDYNVTYLNSAAREDIYESDSMKKVYNTYKYNEHYDSEGDFLTFKNLPEVRVLKGEKLKDYRYSSHRPDGIYHISFSGSPMYDNSGNIIKAIICSRDITEQVNKDKVIKQQKEELEAIIENMSDTLYTINKDYNVTYLNSAAREGIYECDSMKKVYNTYKYNEHYDSEGNFLTFKNLPEVRVLKGEKLKDYRYTSHRPDGIYHISFSGSPMYDNNGNIIKAITCSRDITEQVNKDKVIKQQKEELEAIVENMSDGLFIINKEGIFTMANKLARDILLIPSENHSIKDVYKEIEFLDDKGNLVSYENLSCRKIMRGEKVLAQRLTVKQKDKVIYIEVNATPIYDKEGNFVAGVACIRDVTEQVNKDELIKIQKDELIRMQKSQLSAIIENMNDCLLVFNKDGNIIKYSKKIEDYIGNLSEIITINDYFRHMEVADLEGNSLSEENSLITRIVNGEKILGYKFATRVHNNIVYFELNGNPIYDSKGNFAAGVIMTRDITEEVNYKNKMEETLKIQDEIFANISHELKTPLNVIYSTNQLIELYLKNDSFEANKEKICKNINVIKQNCYRFSKLINNIVDLSKIDSGFFKLSLTNENIVCVIEDIVESVSEYIKGTGIDIIFDTNTEEKIISCDTEKIERIILNLISNAIKFTNPGGIISIDVIDRGYTVEISIKDTGLGIDKKHINNIFKRFYQADKSLTRNAEGSGIGLSLVKSLVELHDGKISIESTVGEGSVFKIELPSRTLEDDEEVAIDKIMPKDNKIEMINIEFSDIYSI